MVTDQQVRKLMKLVKTEKSLSSAAAKAGMCEKTARKYVRSGKLPGASAVPHTWRTRPDAFAAVWEEVAGLLRDNPGLEAKTVFAELQRRFPGRFADGQLRTLQRRVKAWRALEGPQREVFFAQEHRPGELCQSDFTHMGALGVTLGGQPFDHMVYHFVLTYSNWETGTVCFSESFESLSAGMERALFELGGVLFLDEIGDMPMAMQTKLLVAVEKGIIKPVGGPETAVDVRILCATHRDLSEAVEAQTFRSDLYYRIWDIPLRVPPLRVRREDIPLLAGHFLKECELRNGIQCIMTPDAVDALCEYDWPGNVRQLASTVRQLVVFARDGVISGGQVRERLALSTERASAQPQPTEPVGVYEKVPQAAEVDLSTAIVAPPEYPEIPDPGEYRRLHGEFALKEAIERALKEAGNARGAMALLGMPESKYDAFRKWLQRLGIRVREVT